MHEKLKILLSKIFEMKPNDITESLEKEQVYKWDSLTHMELISAVEKEFCIELDMEEIIAMTSVANIIAILQSRGIDHA